MAVVLLFLWRRSKSLHSPFIKSVCLKSAQCVSLLTEEHLLKCVHRVTAHTHVAEKQSELICQVLCKEVQVPQKL